MSKHDTPTSFGDTDNCSLNPKMKVVQANAAYPIDTSQVLESLISEYAKSKTPREVSFRHLVPWLKIGERATHYIHSYPAKLLPQIAHFFLAAEKQFSDCQIVLDPFAGTGTVSLETLLSGRTAFFADANPLARLITTAKTSSLDVGEVRAILSEVKRRYNNNRNCVVPNVVNINYWYDSVSIERLARLREAIESESNPIAKNFLNVTFSSVVKKASYTDPRLSVPVRVKGDRKDATGRFGHDTNPVDIWQLFETQFNDNCTRHEEYQSLQPYTVNTATCVGHDARKLQVKCVNGDTYKPVSDETVDIVITSPPYAGAQKYIRSSSLSLGWLGMTVSEGLRHLESKNIGREHFARNARENLVPTGVSEADELISRVSEINKNRAAIMNIYIHEMREAICEMCRVLKPGGHVVFVIGNNEVCGEVFYSSRYLETIFLSQGLTLTLKVIDEIKSRGLMTKRNKTASMITQEWVLVFQK